MKVKIKKSVWLLLVVCMLMIFAISAGAATRLSSLPNATVNYDYSSGVSVGAIRYISQIASSGYFNTNYWGNNWLYSHNDGVYYGPGSECGTCSISMALSYVGVNKTPKNILDEHNGYTYFSGWGVELLYPGVANGMNNYIGGNGKYSPVIIHFREGGTYPNGHYVILAGRNSSTSYQVVDPARNDVWELTTSSSLYSQIDSSMQYYNSSASIDTQAPTISNVRVTDVSYTGYTVKCTVSDNVGVTRVAFPTWTAYGDQDDVIWADGSMSGNTVTFRVNTSDHNYEYGAYITHIYAYDAAGNNSSVAAYATVPIGEVIKDAFYNGHRYVLYDADVTLDVARAYCEDMGGYLVTITSAAEQNAVNGLLSDYTEHVWAGATDAYSEGNWMWYTGETFKYSYWAEKQPDNNGSGENYLELNFQNKWNDCVGHEKQGFVCEFGNVWDDEINEVTSTVYNKHKYILFDTSISWTMAQSYCESIGGHLVTITDKAENDEIIKLIAKGSKNLYWTGLYDGDFDSVFEWITGEKLPYTNWAIGEPSQTNGEICGQIYAKPTNEKVSGCWNDESNTSWFTPNTFYHIDNVGFICELDSFDCSHTSSNWIIDKQPTCAKEGSKHTQCTTCGEVLETQSIAKLQHTYVKGETVAPTCENQGYTTYTCSGCGDIYYDDFTPILPHTDADADGACDDCGAEIPVCTCSCHKNGIIKFFFNFILFFQKLFGQNKTCVCGVSHY